MATKSRETGWIGSRYVGIPAAMGYSTSSGVDPSWAGGGIAGYRNADDMTKILAPSQAQQDYEYGLGNYWAPDRDAYLSNLQQALYQPQAAVAGRPRSPLEGFVQSKLDDPTLGTTHKYVGGRILQGGGGIEQILADPKFQGWSQVGDDKIRSPEGSVYDLFRDVEGANAPQWTYVGGGPEGLRNNGIRGDYAAAMGQGGANGAGGSYSGSSFGKAPNPTPFNFPQFQSPGAFNYGEYNPLDPFKGPEWKAPTDVSDANDPGYSARLREGQKAIERSAAAKGTLVTGGTLKDLSNYAQDYAANEYQNVYNRAFQDYSTNYQRQASEYDRAAQEHFRDYTTNRSNAFENYTTNFQNALNAYKTNFETQFQPWQANYQQAYQTWQGNMNAAQQQWQNAFNQEQARYNQLYQTTALGQQAINSQAQYGADYARSLAGIYGGYGNNVGDLLTGIGNTTAAGQAASGAAWQNGLTGAANTALNAYMANQMYGQMGQGGTGWDPNQYRYSMYSVMPQGGWGSGSMPYYR